MNSATFWTLAWALMLGIAANEIFELMPWLARHVLRHAAKIEAASNEEVCLIFGETQQVMTDVPGKLAKLGFALGRLAFALKVHVVRQTSLVMRKVARRRKALLFFGLGGLVGTAIGGMVATTLGVDSVGMYTIPVMMGFSTMTGFAIGASRPPRSRKALRGVKAPRRQ